jgi:hypothetical protein
MAFGIQRATLPAEFYDRTSEKLLISPEPQYLHARLILSALSMSLDSMAGANIALPIPGRAIPDVGGDYRKLQDMQFMLSDPIAEEAIVVVNDFSQEKPAPGHVIRFNRPRFTNTTYTFASREVPAGSTISTTPISVGSDQVELTVKRWAGPYDSTNSRVAPYAVSRFDAERSIHPLAKIADLHFTRDFHRTVDGFGVSLFDTVRSANIVYPTGISAVNDMLAVGSNPMDFETLLRAEKVLNDANIPAFGDGKRIAVLTTLQCLQLARDPEFRQSAVFVPELNPLIQGSYFKTVSKTHIYQSTTLNQTNNSSSVPIQYGQMFGPGMVGVGAAGMPRVASSANDNFGEDPMAIWLWYATFGVLDDSFGVSIRTS